MGLRQQKQLTQEIVLDHGLSVTGACKLIGMCRSQYYYVSKKDYSAVISALDDLSAKHPVYGFRKLYAYLRRAGKPWNHKKVYRVYKLLNMNKKRRGKRRLPAREKQPLEQQVSINQKWSMDFMSGSLASGNRFRTFNVIDDCSPEVLCVEIATSISSLRVTRTLEQIIDWRGKPLCLRVDNGPEFTSHHFELWCKDQGIAIQFIQPGKPMQNGYIERFNRSYRKEILDAYLFFNLAEVREHTQIWMGEYNNNRPHEGLGNLTPTELAKNIKHQQQINQLVT